MADGAGHWAPYWVAARLTATARHNWSMFDGWCASRAVDPLALPVDRFLNLVYYWLTRNANERRKREIDSELDRVPANEQQTGPIDEGAWSAEEEMAAFQQAASASSSVG